MPLILLGLIVILGIVIYALIMYGSEDDEEIDTRPVRERYAHIFDKFKKEPNYTIIDDDEDENSGPPEKADAGDGHTMYFPTDAEVEKRKRNIH